MSRKRQLDPEFFVDEEIADFPFEGRLYYQGTWVICEDTGVFEVKHRTLKSQIFPFDDLDTKPLYEQIREKDKYIEYTTGNGKIYAFIRGFHKRQKVDWPSSSHLPLPPEPYLSLIPEKIRERNDYSMNSHSVLTEASTRVEKSRVEKSRVELSRVSREEIKDFKKSFSSKEKLKKHLIGRGFKESHIKEVVTQVFSKFGGEE